MNRTCNSLFDTAAICLIVLLIGTPVTSRSQLVRSGAGPATADITVARDQFRVDLGGGSAGSCARACCAAAARNCPARCGASPHARRRAQCLTHAAAG